MPQRDLVRLMRRSFGEIVWLLLAVIPATVGCTALTNATPTLPGQYALVRDELLIHSDFPLVAKHRLLEDLSARRLDMGRELALPTSNEPIDVYVFESPERFNAFLRRNHPEFPERRAFFVETDTRLMVYARWDDRVAEDLRHEISHAYLHSVVPQLPLWLDEGLAEYFEVPRGHDGLNRAQLDYLASHLEQGDWRPDVRRLERLESSFDMGQAEYAESWAWVHFLLHSRPEHRGLLQGYLEQLRRDGTAEPLSHWLGRALVEPESALAEYIRQLAAANGP